MYSMMTIVNTAVWYIGKLRVNSKSSLHKEKIVSFFFLYFLLYLYEKTDVSWTHYGKHFTIYVNQTIKLYTLNLYSDVWQLFFNKNGKKFMGR